jgi:hypothetical protein
MGDSVEILKLEPEEKSVEVMVKTAGQSKISISPSGKIGFGIEKEKTDVTNSPVISTKTTKKISDDTAEEAAVTQPSGTSTDSTKFTLGPEIGISGTYERTRGYELSYKKFVKWFSASTLQKNMAIWEISKTQLDENIPKTDGLAGPTISVPGFLMFRVKKEKNEQNEYKPQKVKAKILSKGHAREDIPWRFDEPREIEFVGPEIIELTE